MTEDEPLQIKRKWRPSLGLITTALIFSVLALPLIGLLFFRIYENQLLRETEGELIAQAAMLSAVYAHEIAEAPEGAFPIGVAKPADPPSLAGEPYAPMTPSLDLSWAHISPRRAPGSPPAIPADPRAFTVGEKLAPILVETQRTTLAGFRLLDANGVVIAGREELGLSLADCEEAEAALSGRAIVMLRQRVSDEPPPPLYSISRGARIRVFVGFPVVVDGRVRGAVLMSRTPDNIVRNLFNERKKLLLAGLLVFTAAAAIGFVFVRTVTRPISDLVRRADAIAHGDRAAIAPLKRHGASEIAALTESFMLMAKRLSDRSDYLSTFANHVSHELKTPLTAIKGAAELMRDNETSMSAAERKRFLDNLLADCTRMGLLLDRLRELARADNPTLGGSVALSSVTASLRSRFEGFALQVEGEAELPMSAENAAIVFGNLIDNARGCGAGAVQIVASEEAGGLRILVRDNGRGVSEGNRDKIFDAFFTTRREEGGAGMGLMIVRALLRAHGGDITLTESETEDFRGAAFAITLPRIGARKS